jgi:hypothetical protein
MRQRDRFKGISEVVVRVPKRDANKVRELAAKLLDAFEVEREGEA